jgi:major outer membrane protein
MRHLVRYLFFLILPFQGFALYNGNPSFPMMPEEGAFTSKESWFGVKIGYQFNYAYDRRLRMPHRHVDDQRKKTQKYESLTHQGVLTFNFSDRVEIFGTLGGMSFELSQRPFEDVKVSYHTQTHFVWGVGGRAILAYWGDLQVAVNAAYLKSDLPLSSVRVNHHPYEKKHAKAEFREWQIGAGVSYRYNWFVPYLGLDYSDFRTKIEHLHALEFLFHRNYVIFKEVYPLGIFFGFGLSPLKGFNINVEARFINENAVSVSGDFKF